MPGRAIIALEANDFRAGEILLEAQDVVDFRAAPAVDRLIVVADAAEIPRSLREQAQPEILRDVGVLILVHQHVAETVLVLRQHVRLFLKQPDVFQQQIAEIDGVQRLQPRLIGGVEFLAASIGEHRAVTRGNFIGREAAVLPAVDDPGQHPRGPALVVDVGGTQNLLHQPDLVVGVQNGEIGFQPDQLRMPPQNFRADRMEGAKPRHPLHRLADHGADALLHLARRAVGEGHGQNLRRPGAPGRQNMRNPRGENAGLSGARARKHQHRPVERFHRLKLLGVQPFEIGLIAVCCGSRTRGNSARAWRGARRNRRYFSAGRPQRIL